MLTKEECSEAYNNLYDGSYDAGHDFQVDYDVLYQLINEHFDNLPKIEWLKKAMGEDAYEICFKDKKSVAEWYKRAMWHVYKVNELSKELKQLKDNPPLKFEELHDKMWVWDNKYKEYCFIYFIAGKYPHRKYIDNCESDGAFEENRFYLREVKE